MNRWTWSTILIAGVPFLAMFGTVLFGDAIFAYRDIEHFYYPLFHWIDAEWRAGRIPLWSPLEYNGIPIVGDATSSVFYPAKIVFFLPLDFGLRFKLYVLGHVLFAQRAHVCHRGLRQFDQFVFLLRRAVYFAQHKTNAVIHSARHVFG